MFYYSLSYLDLVLFTDATFSPLLALVQWLGASNLGFCRRRKSPRAGRTSKQSSRPCSSSVVPELCYLLSHSLAMCWLDTIQSPCRLSLKHYSLTPRRWMSINREIPVLR